VEPRGILELVDPQRIDMALRAARLHVNDLILEPLQRHDLGQSALRLLRHTKASRRPA
jgi:hypothetical protein